MDLARRYLRIILSSMSYPIQAYLTHCNAPTEGRVPTANDLSEGDRCFRFQFGAYGWTKVDVFADSPDSAFETAVEWLDENAPGHLVSIGETELAAAAVELDMPWPVDTDSRAYEKVVAHAEADLTLIGHPQLTHGQYVLSHEWTFIELSPDDISRPVE